MEENCGFRTSRFLKLGLICCLLMLFPILLSCMSPTKMDHDGDEGVVALRLDDFGTVYAIISSTGTFSDDNEYYGSRSFLFKYDSEGNQTLLKKMDTYTPGLGNPVLDSLGNIYFLGSEWLSKFNTSGENQWYREISEAPYIRSADFDMQGNIYLAGSITIDTILDDDGLIEDYIRDAYVAKLNPSGEVIWKSIFGTDYDDHADCITVGASGNIYVAGTTEGNFDDNTALAPNVSNRFIAKYDLDGNKTLTIQSPSDGEILTNGCLSDDLENVYVSGTVFEKFDSNGNSIWTKEVQSDRIMKSGSNDIYIFKNTWRYQDESVLSIRKFNTDGEELSAIDLEAGDGYPLYFDVDVEPSLQIYFAWGFREGSLTDPKCSFCDQYDVNLSKYISDNTMIWSRTISSEPTVETIYP
jgi:hypothetical protein